MELISKIRLMKAGNQTLWKSLTKEVAKRKSL
jgi:hypothetical protein